MDASEEVKNTFSCSECGRTKVPLNNVYKYKHRKANYRKAFKSPTLHMSGIVLLLLISVLMAFSIIYMLQWLQDIQRQLKQQEDSKADLQHMRNDIKSLHLKVVRLQRQIARARTIVQKQSDVNKKKNDHVDRVAEDDSLDASLNRGWKMEELSMALSGQNKTSILGIVQPHHRTARKAKKKCKGCLPAIQLEGNANAESTIDKSDISGHWKASTWVKQYSKKTFKDRKGRLVVQKAGLYLIYAQISLLGDHKKGFRIMRKRGGPSDIIASCSAANGTASAESCCTVGVFLLQAKDELYLAEIKDNSGATYRPSTSFFGAIKIG